MPCTKRTRAEILADIAKWQAKLSLAEETLDAILETANRKNRFDDAEGAQSVEKRDLADQYDMIEKIEDKLRRLRAEFCGRGTVVRHVNRRRISGGGLHV